MDPNHDFLPAGGQPVADRMRELLARAAQEQVYEQRSSGQVLDEIRQRLEGIEWVLREVRERELDGLTSQLDGVRGQVAEMNGKPPEWAEGLAEHIVSVGDKVQPVAELPSLWADVGVIAENVDEGLNRIQSVLDSSKSITDATLRAAHQMDELSKRLDRLAGSMEAASVRFNRLDKTLAELGHRSELLENEVKGVAGRVEQALGEMGSRVDQGLEAVGGRVEGVGGRLDGLDGRLEDLSGRFEGLEGHLLGLEGRVEGVDDRLEAVNLRITQLPTTMDVGELHRKLTELVERPLIDPTDRFDALEKRLTEAVDPLLDELRSRPDREELEDTISKIVESSHAELGNRITIAREEMVQQVGGVQDELAKRAGELAGEIARRVESVHDEIGRRVELIGDDMTRRVDSAQDDFVRKADAVTGEAARRYDATFEEMAKRVQDLQDDVLVRVDGVRSTVGKQVTSVHEDLLKRLTTLEETMLALAEALLRPRREAQD